MREVAHPRPSLGPAATVEPAPFPDVEDENDPYYFGWRDLHETLPDGSEKLRRVPLTYRDLLDPQIGDFIAEDTIHHDVIAGIESILKRRYESDTTVAVWSDLKIAFVIAGLTTGPGPDICVIAGVRDRDRRRTSFRYGEEPGEIRLATTRRNAPTTRRNAPTTRRSTPRTRQRHGGRPRKRSNGFGRDFKSVKEILRVR